MVLCAQHSAGGSHWKQPGNALDKQVKHIFDYAGAMLRSLTQEPESLNHTGALR